MRFDRNTYFNYVRDVLFEGALTQQQVDGQSVILAVWEYQAGGTPMTDIRWLAYMLATVYHETAYKNVASNRVRFTVLFGRKGILSLHRQRFRPADLGRQLQKSFRYA